jgi:transcriptional regulator with PAS, ATPase and Fis domain
MKARFTFSDIIAKSPVMRQLVDYAKIISDSPSTVLIEGESGTGKEVFAQSIHNASSRSRMNFVAINCAAIPDNLIESELFGYSDGAFTGAKKGGLPGKFELAHKGTLFLDEIGEMSTEMQAKLLRAIQEGAITRIGGNKNIKVDVRLIAASNKDLKHEIEKETFRLDLFYRLSVIPIKIPPLRERKEDLPSLMRLFLKAKSKKLNKPLPQIRYTLLQELLDYTWPGNIRELENYIEQLVNLSSDKSLQTYKHATQSPNIIPAPEKKVAGPPISLAQMEQLLIRETLDYYSNNISKTAQSLGISRNTLYQKLKRMGLTD